MKTSALIAGVAVAAVVAAAGYFLMQKQGSQEMAMKPAAPKAQLAVDMAAPVGIQLQALGPGQGYGFEGSIQFGSIPPFDTAYADGKGNTLYTYDNDKEPGKSACDAECAKTWVPATAADDAKPFGKWSVITRADGTKQWAVKGKPLYTFIKDEGPGSVGGYSARKAGGFKFGKMAAGAAKQEPVPPEWHAAIFRPSEDIALPHGIAVRDVAEASGQALADLRGITIYTYTGDFADDKNATSWAPVGAPQLAHPVGDFNFIVREDGVKQWTYKGLPLYTYDKDLAPTYANGDGVDKRFQVALITRYPTPAEVTIQRTPGRGKVLASAQGLTLYRRDAVGYQTGGGHSFRRGVYFRPGVGREVGISGCDAECTKTWHPLVAPANAKPQGYWDIVSRPDGTKQWAYRGYPMYSYDGDKKPGDMSGNDIYDIALSDDPNKITSVGTPEPGANALYWLLAEP